jgi:uncharacterized protein (UPF0332 family)
MTPNNEILVTIAVEKSKLAIKAAQDNIKDNNLENALNRIYYSVFYIVMALAYKNDFITSKHSQLVGSTINLSMKTKCLTMKYIKYIKKFFYIDKKAIMI